MDSLRAALTKVKDLLDWLPRLKEARGGTEDAALAGEPLKRIRPA